MLVNAVLDDAANAEEAYENAIAEIDRLVSLLEQPSEHRPVSVPSETPSVPFESNMAKDTFFANVAKAKQYITAGDIIQVVGSQRFSARFNASPIDLYRAARSVNPSPYMFLLEFNGFSLVGASPEIHVRCEDQTVEIRPIAGTRPRGGNETLDLEAEQEMLNDEKERAEHVMLVDLGRNDVGRVSEYGTVKVTNLMFVERYSHVMHLVSNIEGTLRKDLSAVEALRSCFPAGTLSGAPKIRAMEIIEELEPTRRGIYGGSVLYADYSGNLTSCIAIRTLLVEGKKGFIQAGAGIVADSVPEKEYEESLNKAKAVVRAIERAREG